MARRWFVGAILVSTAIVAAATGAGTVAFFTSQATATGVTITSGTVDLKLYDSANDRVVGTLVSAIQHEGLYPGWRYEKEPLVLYNDGSLELVVTLSAVTEDPPGAPGMADQLYVTVDAWTDLNGNRTVDPGETTLLWGPGRVREIANVSIGRIENDFDRDHVIADAYDAGSAEQDFMVGADPPTSDPPPQDPHSGFKAIAFSWEFRATGNVAVDNSFQGKKILAAFIFQASDQTLQEPP